MNELTTIDAYGLVTEPATLTMQRLLPGPVERIWAHLTGALLGRVGAAARGVCRAVPGLTSEAPSRRESAFSRDR